MSWNQHIESGLVALKKSDYPSAEQALKQALRYANQNYSREDSRLAMALSLLGHLYFKTEDFQTGEKLLEQSLNLHLSSQTLIDPCIIMDLFSLGEIKMAGGKKAEACSLYYRAVNKLRDGQPYQQEIAEEAAQRFQQLLDATKGKLSPSEMAMLDQLLTMETDESLEPATDCSGTATVTEPVHEASRCQSGGHELAQVWQTQFNNGVAALKEENEERETQVTAYLNLESSLALARRLFLNGDERLVSNIKALGDVSTRLQMFHQAELLYLEAIGMAERSWKDSVWVLKLFLALSYAESNKFEQAKRIFEKVAIPEHLAGTPYAEELLKRIDKARGQIRVHETAADLLEQAMTSESDGDMKKAERLANNALLQLRQAFPPDHPAHAKLLRYRSGLLKELGNVEQSEELMRRVERIEKSNQAQSGRMDRITGELPKPGMIRRAAQLVD